MSFCLSPSVPLLLCHLLICPSRCSSLCLSSVPAATAAVASDDDDDDDKEDYDDNECILLSLLILFWM